MLRDQHIDIGHANAGRISWHDANAPSTLGRCVGNAFDQSLGQVGLFLLGEYLCGKRLGQFSRLGVEGDQQDVFDLINTIQGC
mgnify:CR=1 FL=1